jgi:hypothetical protein
MLSNYLFCALAGSTWYKLHLASIILFSTLLGGLR